MSMFLIYDAENYEYILQPAGYAVLVILLAALIILVGRLGRRKTDGQRMAGLDDRDGFGSSRYGEATYGQAGYGQTSYGRALDTKKMVFCAMAMALATVTSFIKFAQLPFGGSITLFSMFFISLIGWLYGPKLGLITGLAYGVLQLITGPYIYAPLQVLLDYPLAFGALGLSGFFWRRKHGLIIGYVVGAFGRYLCHVISGYVFFAEYAPEGMNPMIYTLGYNLTYILPEVIATVAILCIPSVMKALGQVKAEA